ncbi:MAG: TlpA family protein disulfide reductase [Candidatus Thiodiazotropha taylori]|nr:TlpA family protein disulfide reductase [Candidatus Thiodiazotropha taylori]
MRLLLLLLTLFSYNVYGNEINLTDSEGNDITIQVTPADGELLMIWLVDHDEHRPLFESLLNNIAKAGIEVWRVDLLEAYFLPRSSEEIRTLNGTGVAAILSTAHQQSDKRIVLAAYDRMPLPLLRGVRQWQSEAEDSRFTGAVLFYPNLFGPAPIAGEPPSVDPILYATNTPLMIYQPSLGSHRLRMNEVLSALWQSGSPSYLYLVPEVRDWFIMDDEEHKPTQRDIEATQRIPQQIKQFAALMDHHPKPLQPLPLNAAETEPQVIRSLVQLDNPSSAPNFDLADIQGKRLDSSVLQGRVGLINFWATWCPPCVEEIPSLNRLQAIFKDRDIEIISIDFRETPEEMADFLQRIPVDFPVLMDQDGETSLNWQVFSFPSSFIIDRAGRIRYSANRAINWDSQEVVDTLNQLLTEKP